MIIRTAKMEDLTALTQIGQACYPKEEAVTQADYQKRLSTYPDQILIDIEMGGYLL